MQKTIHQLTALAIRHSRLILGFWAVFSIAGIVAFTQLKWDTSHAVWFIPDDPVIQDYQELQKTFGSPEKLIIGLKHPRLLQTVEHAHFIHSFSSIIEKLPAIETVDSITSAKQLKADHKTQTITLTPLLPDLPNLTEARLQDELPHLQRQISGLSPFFSRQKDLTLLTVTLSETPDPIQTARKTVEDINQIFSRHHPAEMEILFSGTPALSAKFYDLSLGEMKTHLTTLTLVMIVMLWLFLRSRAGVIGPLLVLSASNAAVGLFAYSFGIKLNNITAILPVILCGISVTEMVHVTSHYSRLKKSNTQVDALHLTMAELILPSSISLITTIDGFLGLLTCPLLPLIQLGILASIGVFTALVATFTLGPALLNIMPPDPPRLEKIFSHSGRAFSFFSHPVSVILFVLALGICLTGLNKKFPSGTYLDYFSSSQKIRTDTHELQKSFGGVIQLEWLIESKEGRYPLSPAVLDEISKLQNLLQQETEIYSTDSIAKRLSMADVYLSGVSRPLKKIEPNLISQYLALYDSFATDVPLTHWFDASTNRLRITSLVPVMSSNDFAELIQRVQNRAARRFPNLTLHPTGVAALFAVMESHLQKSLYNSMLFSAVLIFVFLAWVFRDIKLTLLAVITNTLPLIAIYGLMRLMQIPLDAGIAILFAVSLGIIVDDTTHYLHNLKKAQDQGLSVKDSLRQVFSITGTPLSVATLVLASSFLITAFSDFVPNQHFGFYGSLTLIVAALTDLTLIPGLLLLFGRKNKKPS